MGKLSCGALNCVHNLNGLCAASRIQVSGNTAHASSGTSCETFMEKGIKNAIINMGNMNIGGEIRQIFTLNSVEMSPNIRCEASHCTYNVNKICTASNVFVSGDGANTSEGTRCETFIRRF